MSQLVLFDRGPPQIPDYKRVVDGRTCTPDRVGSGPSGEKCGTCWFACRERNYSGSVRWMKCEKVRRRWTGGKATDIKARWPACSHWFPRKIPKEVTESATLAEWLKPDIFSINMEQFLTPEGCLAARDWYNERGDKLRSDWCVRLSQMDLEDEKTAALVRGMKRRITSEEIRQILKARYNL